MKLTFVAVVAVACLAFVPGPADALKDPPTTLQIDVVKPIPDGECTKMSSIGASLSVHYTGKLFENDKKFDSSRDRGYPFVFILGQGNVIKGWDQGLQNMCVGEQRRLTIPSYLGKAPSPNNSPFSSASSPIPNPLPLQTIATAYGDRGAGRLIPPGAALVFDVELLDARDPADSIGDEL
ncbi:hypothetical protein BC936DRAFT_137445 [Jimgerdemannia flammicorona]|uniref:peptidylprolyl isomerase n=1 Tax=Jimgerdemannia flammicorona TaxID=994334 RepID=A0A433CXD5_9FUNG|nr:hypothetical protein BC936DRAFT_137445 [Jimgerdemannia flammicorona]